MAAHALTSDADLDAFLDVLGTAARTGCRRSATAPCGGGSPAVGGSIPRGRFKAALVTGASRGLGAGIARALARRGCDVVLLGRDGDALGEVAAQLAAETGVRTRTVVLDLARGEALATWIAASDALLAGVDVLVNAAAEAEAEPFLGAEAAAGRRAFEANVFAPQTLARAVLPGMVARRRGAILNVVTAGGRNALPLFATYAATKGALWAWSEALGRELAGTGVAVTTFLPPHMGTATQRRLGRRALPYYRLPGEAGRLASPTKVGEAAVRALLEGRRAVVPAAVRISLALNALAPWVTARRVESAWRGLGAAAAVAPDPGLSSLGPRGGIERVIPGGSPGQARLRPR